MPIFRRHFVTLFLKGRRVSELIWGELIQLQEKSCQRKRTVNEIEASLEKKLLNLHNRQKKALNLLMKQSFLNVS